jgi:hypothetical protein
LSSLVRRRVHRVYSLSFSLSSFGHRRVHRVYSLSFSLSSLVRRRVHRVYSLSFSLSSFGRRRVHRVYSITLLVADAAPPQRISDGSSTDLSGLRPSSTPSPAWWTAAPTAPSRCARPTHPRWPTPLLVETLTPSARWHTHTHTHTHYSIHPCDTLKPLNPLKPLHPVRPTASSVADSPPDTCQPPNA